MSTYKFLNAYYNRMVRAVKKGVYRCLTYTRSTRFQRPIMRLLVTIHNTSYHLISLFASKEGIHPKHEIIKYHEFFAKNVKRNDQVLDAGCGKGEVTYYLATIAQFVDGIDISKRNIEHAQKNCKRPNIRYFVGDIGTYPFEAQYDVIILSNVLEHIEDRKSLLLRLKEHAPKILIRVPLITRDWVSVYKKREGLEYRLDKTHKIEYDLETFMSEMKQAGLIVDTYEIKFGELYVVLRKRP